MRITTIIVNNKKYILYSIFIVIIIIVVITSLNTYYEFQQNQKSQEFESNINNNNNTSTVNTNGNNVTIDNLEDNDVSNLYENTIENTMKKFVNYCNNRKISEAYAMLTDDCKNALYYTTEEAFEEHYINERFKEPQEYSMIKWSETDNRTLYLVKFYGDLLATGGESGTSQEYYTFIYNNGSYKININNFVYGEYREIEYQKDGITIKVGHVDVFNSYERAQITITNNTENKICMTGNKYSQNVYLRNSDGTVYSSINSQFDIGTVVINPNFTMLYTVEFNKTYNITNEAKYLVFSDVILNYDEYLQSENKLEYSNRTSLVVDYNN